VKFDGQQLLLPSLGADFELGLSMFVLLQRDEEDVGCKAVFSASNGVEVDDITLGIEANAVLWEVADKYINDASHVLASHAPKILRVLQPPTGVTHVSIDGEPSGEAPLLYPKTTVRKDVRLGHSLYTDCYDLRGTIGEILLYNRELAASEVSDVQAYLQERWACCEVVQ
jgi:hypothetical protein